MKKCIFSVWVLTLLVVGGSRTACAQFQPFNEADTRELQAFRLNDDLVERYRNATLALMEYAKAHPSKDDSDDEKASKKSPDLTLSDMVTGMSKAPQFTSLLQSKGISPRQYVETMLVLVGGYSAIAMQREGQMATVKPTAIISAANLDYIKRNYDHLSTLLAGMSGSDN
jgi:hypothetical protein